MKDQPKEEKKKLKKRNVEIRKLEEGDSFDNVKFIGRTTRDWTDKETGETKPLTTMVFQEENETRFGFFADAGFTTAFESALIKEGEIITIKKLEKIDLGGGRSCNQYDILS